MGAAFPLDRMERLKREYGTKMVEALFAEFDRIDLEDQESASEDDSQVPPHYIECVYDAKHKISFPVVVGSKGGKYFYDSNGQKKYINQSKVDATEMIDPNDPNEVVKDNNPALKTQDVVINK